MMRPRPILRRKIEVPRNCSFCKGNKRPSFKDLGGLSSSVSDRGKILAASRTGLCPCHQRILKREVKRARFLALL